MGLKGNRCAADEKLVSALKTESQGTMWIFDSRPQLNAVANMLRGGGYESENVYKVLFSFFSLFHHVSYLFFFFFSTLLSFRSFHALTCELQCVICQQQDCTLEFNNIENIHDMRHSLESLVKVCREATEDKTIEEWERDVAATKVCFLFLASCFLLLASCFLLLASCFLLLASCFSLLTRSSFPLA